MVIGDQVAGQAQVAGQGLGDGLLGRLGLHAFGQAFDRLLGQGDHRGDVAVGVVVHGAGQGGLEQREVLIGALPGPGQDRLGLLAGH